MIPEKILYDPGESSRGQKVIEKSDTLGMTKQRVFLLSFATVLFMVGSFYDIITDQEHWPLSNYPMFSGNKAEKHGDGIKALWLYGVTQEEPHQEIAMTSNNYFKPVSSSKLKKALRKANKKRNSEKRERALNGVVSDSLERYEAGRQAGRHNGPPIQALRLYEMEWDIDDQAFEARGEDVDEPDQRELLIEVEQS